MAPTRIDLGSTAGRIDRVTGLTETVTTRRHDVGTGTVSDDLDSGGVYGTIPSIHRPAGHRRGDTITVYDGSTVLYSYIRGTELGDTVPTSIVGQLDRQRRRRRSSTTSLLRLRHRQNHRGPLTS